MSSSSPRYAMAVPYGDDMESIRVALNEFPTRKIIMLAPANLDSDRIERLKAFLLDEGVEFELQTVSDEAADGFFNGLARIKEREDNLIVNVSVGTSFYSYVLLCAAMATGVMAFGVFDGNLAFLPVSCSISHGK